METLKCQCERAWNGGAQCMIHNPPFPMSSNTNKKCVCGKPHTVRRRDNMCMDCGKISPSPKEEPESFVIKQIDGMIGYALAYYDEKSDSEIFINLELPHNQVEGLREFIRSLTKKEYEKGRKDALDDIIKEIKEDLEDGKNNIK
jgi:hypothetical protein